MSKIDFVRYQTFYDALRPVVGRVPLTRLPAGAFFLRNVQAVYHGRPATPDSARTIFGGSTADVRWSGARPRGPGSGALYVSVDLDAVSNELFHYARDNKSLPLHPSGTRPLAQYALKERRIFRFKTGVGLTLIDLSVASPSADAFLRELGTHPAVRTALGAARYTSVREACDDPRDYSFSRALGHALVDAMPPLIDGLKVTTARDEWPTIGESGDNLALFGQDGRVLPYLVPLSETIFDVDAAGKLTQTVRHLA